MEIWKIIDDFPSYEVSNTGYVRRKVLFDDLDNKKIYTYKGVATHPISDKYMKISLSKKGIVKTCYLSRLVAEAHLPNPNNYKFVRYKDGDIFNNHVDNLEWYSKETPTQKRERLMKEKKEKERKMLLSQFESVLDLEDSD